MFPDKNSQYSDKAYWDARYNSQKGQHKRQEEGTEKSDETLISPEPPFYDWFESVNNMAELIDCIIQEKFDVVSEQTRSLNNASVQNCMSTSHLKLLMNGCGNSRLGELLVDRGYTFIMNIDFSETLIHSMRTYYQSFAKYSSSLHWLLQDIRTMADLTSGSYDVVIDKATLDVFYCQDNEDPWNPSEAVKIPVTETLRQIYRVLKVGGLFIYVTFGQPPFRKPLLLTCQWSELEVRNINAIYFIYIMRK